MRFTRDGETLTVAYALPRVLTGAENHVEFTGEGSAKADLRNCDVRYKDLKFNDAEREAAIKAVSKTAAEISQRQLVALAFVAGGEPHGVLQIPDYTAPRRSSYQPD